MDPEYNPAYVTFMQKYDGILAVPNLRGGGEFGKKWHDAGKRENKVRGCIYGIVGCAHSSQVKSVDDFIAATYVNIVLIISATVLTFFQSILD